MTSKEYRTLHANEASKLDRLVSEALQQGYRLHGSPYATAAPTGTFTLFCQAVVSPDVQDSPARR